MNSNPATPRSVRAPSSRLGRILLLAACALAGGAGAAGPSGEPLLPIPPVAKYDPDRVALGRRLFHDPRLSADGQVSCASCHDLARAGVDGRSRSRGVHGRLTDTNAPSVLNAALNFRQMWNGRAPTLEAQVEMVMEAPAEMGATWTSVLQKLAADREYRTAFAAAYPDGITKANVVNAIATFERTLLTPDSRFDRYLRGESNALTDLEKLGYAKFKQYGCASCHQGVNVGGNMFQKLGVVTPYLRPRGSGNSADLGRLQLTGLERDRHVFKVPSLRNVALTAPYFHDGSVAALDEAVALMFRHQLGRPAPKQDQEAVVRFLHTLTAPGAR
jgi:cytochrome c peroxidase